jgi:hypothetical protein
MKRLSTRVGLAIGFIFVLTTPYGFARGCATVFPTFKVRPDFTVTVQVPAGAHRDGVRIAIHDVNQKPTPPDTLAAEAFTDETGRATFHGIKAGRYVMYVERNEIEGDAVQLEVVDSPALRALVLAWPVQRIFKSEKMAGTLVRAAIPGVPQFDKEQSLHGIKLTLTQVSSGREVGQTTTDEKGNFAFSEVAPGLYAMHIGWNGDQTGYILLDVDLSTKDTEPAIYSINPTDCGLGASKR